MDTALAPEDQRHVEAADGWLSLGNLVEANEELGKVESKNRLHPEVLQARWFVCAQAGKWDVCLGLATAITQVAPERRIGWLHRAQSLGKLGRIREAKEVLLSAGRQFHPDCTISFYLAGYCLQLGQVKEARGWLERAIKAEAEDEELRRLKLRSRDDSELEPLGEGMGNLSRVERCLSPKDTDP